MAKFRTRVSAKGKRWKKGQSSSSNPATTKFRDAARSRFFQENLGPSNLTQEAVEKHDAFTADRPVVPMEDDEETFTMGGKTFKTFQTFATDWSECSNLSFNKLLSNFRSDSMMHKEMLAVLAAITEVIKSEGGKETTTEYFAALMTALESEEENETSLVAILNLQGMCMKGVPASVLQSRFSEIARVLVSKLAQVAVNEQFPVIRPLIGCLSVLLRAQESAAWNDMGTLKVLDAILAFVSHTKPKIRKAAQHSVTALVKGNKMTPVAVTHVARHCIRLIEGISTGGVTTTLHTLSMLRDILHCFPKKELKETCEAILKVMTMNNVLLTSCGMQALHGMFLGRPSVNSLPSQRNAKLITALYDYQPPPLDAQPTQAWVAVMQEAYINLAKTDLRLCIVNLPKFFTVTTDLYLSEKPEVQSAATHAIEAMITECVTPAAEPGPVAVHFPEIAKLMEILQSRLSYQYHSCWTHVLHLMTAFFKACGETCSKCILPCLKALAELRDSYQFAYVNELDRAVGSAVRSLGPHLVLQAIPFRVNTQDPKREFKRSWLLPILKDNIKKATLKFFMEFFVPLTHLCREESSALKEKNDQIGAHSYDLLHSQIWSLLPSFSIMPPDISETFPGMAKLLGMILSNKKELRMIVLSCLRRLISFASENNRTEDVKTISKFGKNYIPIMFNIYTTEVKGTDEEGTRLAAFETIKVYLAIMDNELQADLFSRARKKLMEPEQTQFMKDSLLDLLKGLIQYQNTADVKSLFDDISSKVLDKNELKNQKKYYRLLEEICTCTSEGVKEFMEENLDKLMELLLSSLSKSSANSKGARLKCLLQLVQRAEAPGDLVESILPEAVLCVKDVNTKCRDTAFKLLITMTNYKDSSEYIQMIMAGLAGNQSVVAATLLALTAVMFHLKDTVAEETEQTVLNNVGVLALGSSREVASCSLSFIKAYLQSHSKEKVYQLVPNLIKVLSNMLDDCKKHARTKTRDILSRLVRWFGSDSILRLIPHHDNILKARVKNLGKIQDRRKKQKDEEKKNKGELEDEVFAVKGKPKTIDDILAESDSEIEYMEEEETAKPAKKKKNTYIKENPEDIVDFTDAGTSKNISITKPVKPVDNSIERKPKKEIHFRTSLDGRLIIDGNEDDEYDYKYNVIPEYDDDDYLPSDEELEPENEDPQPGRKRKLTSDAEEPPNKYQAGGSGIHRVIQNMFGKKKRQKGPRAVSGEVYQSSKAGGDVRRRDMPEPYAYLPLRRDALNKRKKAKTSTEIKEIAAGAKRGAIKGMLKFRVERMKKKRSTK